MLTGVTRKTMQAAVVTGYGKPLALREIPIPEPGPDELLVKIEACGVCHSDLDVRQGSTAPASPNFPLVPGHEGVGRVVGRGPGCRRVEEGTRVGLPWMHETCGQCRECLTGYESFCSRHRGRGFDVDGGFAEYALLKEHYACVIPESLTSIDAAPLLCAGVTAYGAIRKADLAPGKTCAIFGCGGLGQYAIQLAKAAGARVIAVDAAERKLELARRLGADHVLLSTAGTGAAIRSLGGADACLNFAPTNRVWPAIVEAVNARAWIVSVAQVPEPVPLNLEWLLANGVRITGTSVGTRQELADLLRLGVDLRLRIDIETIPLARADEALDRLAQGRVDGRLVIDFSQP